jgi:hypothetical protein
MNPKAIPAGSHSLLGTRTSAFPVSSSAILQPHPVNLLSLNFVDYFAILKLRQVVSLSGLPVRSKARTRQRKLPAPIFSFNQDGAR